MPQHAEGQIVHVEIPVADIAAGRKFFGDVFGFSYNEWGDTSTYLLFMDGANKFGGGLTTYAKPAGDSGPLFYIYAGDIEGKLAQIEAAGGKTVAPKSEIPGVGWYGVFADPFGNHIGLFSSN
jgi:predicted enzyme related to lactoylglutathione lyase